MDPDLKARGAALENNFANEVSWHGPRFWSRNKRGGGQSTRSATAGLRHINEVINLQGHLTDRFGGISVRKTCNRLKFSVREMSSQAFLINAFCFQRDKNDVLGTKIGQLGFSERQ